MHGVAVPEAAAGQRSAIALSGVERDAVGRGDVVVSSAHWHAVHMLTVRARIIASSEWLLQPRQRVRVHAGTAEVLARAVLLDADVLSAGEQGWVQLRLEAPVVARVGDRVVIRSYSPVTTIGGGVVVEVGGRKRSSMDPASERNFEEIISSDEARSVRAALKAADSRGASDGELTVHTPHGPAAIARALRAIAADAVQVGERWYARDVVERITRCYRRGG